MIPFRRVSLPFLPLVKFFHGPHPSSSLISLFTFLLLRLLPLLLPLSSSFSSSPLLVLVNARRVFPLGFPHHPHLTSLFSFAHSSSSPSPPYCPSPQLLSFSFLPFQGRPLSRAIRPERKNRRKLSERHNLHGVANHPTSFTLSPSAVLHPPPSIGKEIGSQKEETRKTAHVFGTHSSLSFLPCLVSFSPFVGQERRKRIHTDTCKSSLRYEGQGKSREVRKGVRNLLPFLRSFFSLQLSPSFLTSSTWGSLPSSPPPPSSPRPPPSLLLSRSFLSSSFFQSSSFSPLNSCSPSQFLPYTSSFSFSSSFSSFSQHCRVPSKTSTCTSLSSSQPSSSDYSEREGEQEGGEEEEGDSESFVSPQRWRAPDYRRIDPLRDSVEKREKDEEREQANLLSHDVYFDFYGSLEDDIELEKQTEKAVQRKKVLRRHFDGMLSYGKRLYSKAVKTKEGRKLERMLMEEEEEEDAREDQKSQKDEKKERRITQFERKTQEEEEQGDGVCTPETHLSCTSSSELPAALEKSNHPQQENHGTPLPSSSSPLSSMCVSSSSCSSQTSPESLPRVNTISTTTVEPERREVSSKWIEEHEADVAILLKRGKKREWQEDVKIGDKEVTLVSQAWGGRRGRRRRREKKSCHTPILQTKSEGHFTRNEDEMKDHDKLHPSEHIHGSPSGGLPSLHLTSPSSSSPLPDMSQLSSSSSSSASFLPRPIEEEKKEEEFEEGAEDEIADLYELDDDDEEDEDLPEAIRHLDEKDWIEEVWFEGGGSSHAHSPDRSIDGSIDTERRRLEAGSGWRSYRKTVDEVEQEIEAALREEGLEEDSFMDAFPGEEEVEEVMRRRKERRKKKKRESLDVFLDEADIASTQHDDDQADGGNDKERKTREIDNGEKESDSAGWTLVEGGERTTQAGREEEEESVLDETGLPSERRREGDVWSETSLGFNEGERETATIERENENEEVDSRFWNLRQEEEDMNN